MDQTLLENIIIETAAGTGAWGIATTLFALTTYTLIKKGIKASKSRQALLAISFFMYIGACVSEIVYLLKFIESVKVPATPTPIQSLSRARFYCLLLFTRIEYFLSDGVVCWRAWALYPLNRVARVSLAMCMLCSFAAILTDAVAEARALLNEQSMFGTAISDLVYYIPLLFTNVVATALIGYKYWQYRREIGQYIHNDRRTTHAGNILVLLTNSGLLYCFFWIISMLSGPAIMGDLGAEIFECVLPQLSAIYLMVVVLVVLLQIAVDMDSIFTTRSSSEMRFATHAHSASRTRDSLDTLQDNNLPGPRIGQSFVEKVTAAVRWDIADASQNHSGVGSDDSETRAAEAV